MNDAIVKAVVHSAYKGEISDRPEIIATRLNEVRRIEESIADLKGQLQDELDRHESEVERIDGRIRAIRKTCGHECKTYHGDPAGGSDSCHICEICGAEL